MVRTRVIEIEGLRDLEIKTDTDREVQGVGMNMKTRAKTAGKVSGA